MGRRYTGFSRDQEFIVAIATKIPIRDRTVNKVLCTEVLEHIVEDSVMMDESQRIMDTPGVLVCSSPNVEFVFRSKKVSHETIGPEHHVRPGYSPRRLKDLLVGAGFKEICLAFALPCLGLYWWTPWNVFTSRYMAR